MHKLDIPESVRAVGRAGAGTNNIPVDAMSQRGVPVFNAPGANANAVKELVLAGLLMAARNLVPAVRFVDGLRGSDEELNRLVEDNKKHYAGIELPRRTLGILGLGTHRQPGGRCGDQARHECAGLRPRDHGGRGMESAVAGQKSAQHRGGSQEQRVRHPACSAAAGDPAPDQSASAWLSMRHGAVLLNFARDEIVDAQAVVEALAAKRLKYYVCDFPNSAALDGNPGVVALPHLGASTREAEDNCAVMVANQVREYLEHGNIRNAVNFPDVVMERESPYRVGIANANVPNMLGQISTAMAAAGLNIHNMLNKSKREMAYTLVDVDSPVSAEVLRESVRHQGRADGALPARLSARRHRD